MSGIVTDWNELQKTLDQLAPGQKLQLIEELARSLRVTTSEAHADDLPANLDRLRRELVGLPVCNPADGFAARNHDRELYGEVG